MMRAPSRARVTRGFTLVEMLVVMVLTGMIVSILLQALQQVLRLQTRFGVEAFSTQQGEMYTEWYRQSVNALMPDYREGPNRFKGGEREFSGLTLSPLTTAAESLQPFAWRLRFDAASGQTQLRYGMADDAPVVLSWPGDSGKFVYFDEKNEPHDAWPPFLGKWAQLPRAINLEYGDGEGAHVVVTAPKGPEDPLPRKRDFQD